jgi:hypothetical protein
MNTEMRFEIALADHTIAVACVASAMERSPKRVARALRTVRSTTRRLDAAVRARVRETVATAATEAARKYIEQQRSGEPVPEIRIVELAEFAAQWAVRWRDQFPPALTPHDVFAMYQPAFRLALVAGDGGR